MMERSAVISECGLYRYSLSRKWNGSLEVLTFWMLNPSTADALQDDPTIRRCIGFARRDGYGGIEVVNLFSYRSTDPSNLPKDLATALGPDNLEHQIRACMNRDVVMAWGAHGSIEPAAISQAAYVAKTFGKSVTCLGETKSGAPRHPLYVAGSQPLVPWWFTKE